MTEKPTYEALIQRITMLEREKALQNQREVSLRKSEACFRLLFDGSKDSIFVHRLDDRGLPGQFIQVNQEACARLGYLREELLQMSPLDIAAPEMAEQLAAIADILKIDGSALFETIHVARDGRRIPMESFVRVLTIDGEPTVLSTSRDITARKRAEAALLENEALQGVLLDNLPAGVIIVDPQTRIIERVNDHVSALFGAPVDHLMGRRCHALLCPATAGACPVCDLGQTMDNSEREMLRKDGSRLPILKTVKRIQLNGREKLLECFVDLSERKRVEMELRESRKRLEDIVNFLPDATLAIDQEKRVIIWNKAIEEMTGVPAAEMIGKGDYVYTVPFYGEARPQLMDLIFVDHGDIASRYPKINHEGECLTTEVFCNALYENKGAWIFAKASPLHDPSGNIVGAIESIRDITERKRAETEQEKLHAQLSQAQKMESVGRLAGGVAHDFNNMLQSITGQAEMALNKIDSQHPLHGNLSEILRAGLRSADLTRQLLAFARKQTINPIVLDLNETISGMLKMLHRLIGEDIDLSWKPALNLWPVRIDPSQVDQVLVNLCVNARDAITGVGSVSISTRNIRLDQSFCETHAEFIPGEYAMFAVSDTGAGMKNDMIDRIFEPFFTTKELGKGTGLGLSMVYGIVKQNNGFIYVYSEPEQGTTFRIYLPRCADKAENGPEEAKKSPSRGTETVLLVEDDNSILDICREVLESLGYKVLTTQSPRDALAMANSYPEPIHLLITDVIMPEMNGQELRYRMHDIKPEIKVIFISGYTANVIAQHGVLDKGINFLQKPFSVQDLAEKVREVLG